MVYVFSVLRQVNANIRAKLPKRTCICLISCLMWNCNMSRGPLIRFLTSLLSRQVRVELSCVHAKFILIKSVTYAWILYKLGENWLLDSLQKTKTEDVTRRILRVTSTDVLVITYLGVNWAYTLRRLGCTGPITYLGVNLESRALTQNILFIKSSQVLNCLNCLRMLVFADKFSKKS